ncbi:hypothetical protein ED208_08215 [Stagnimonas aquatica]|uniref:Lipoprotein n=1 Tax=Stagnimonas aquatica TaxID=2689987 RepID=A0A3N0VE30_9GAMM|nr:hypothetical protein [Stagnimonas aquatica]ROH90951.1 hypothetical protein ED208_08215 [Stagnimonas aquatica]
MRLSLIRYCCAALIAGLAACSHDSSRFVKPVATPVAGNTVQGTGSRYDDGYLRIFVSSNLDANGRALDFGKEDQRPAMLLISARFGKGTVASFASDTDPEIPVLLYDVQSGKTVSSVVNNALLTEGLLVDPESLSKSPHLQIYVRGVPADKAHWVTNLLAIANDEPIMKLGLGFIPGGSAVNLLSTRLGSLLSEEIKSSNKPWEEKTLLGLRSDQGLAALDGRQFVVMLNPSTTTLEPPSPDLRRCPVDQSPTGLCNADGKPWAPAQAYVRFELDVSDYRSVKDFLGTAVSCEADERVWGEYRALIASGQLARRQTQYERHLLSRGELLLAIRRAQADSTPTPYAGRLLYFAQQASLLGTPDDAYWAEHFRDRAKQLDACVRSTAIKGQSSLAGLWDDSRAVFARTAAYPGWRSALAEVRGADAPVLREAEDELGRLNHLLALDELRGLDRQSLESLLSLSNQLRQMLLPAYERIAQQTVGANDLPAEARIAHLEALALRSACTDCSSLLRQRAEALRASLRPPEPPPASAEPTAPAADAATVPTPNPAAPEASGVPATAANAAPAP